MITKFSVSYITALVIDDDDVSRQLISKMLSVMNCQTVYEASSGGDGIHLAALHKPHIIICDLNMQPVDGMMVIAAMKNSIDENINKIPIVLFSGSNTMALSHKALSLGANGVLHKPFTPKNFSQYVHDLTTMTYKLPVKHDV